MLVKKNIKEKRKELKKKFREYFSHRFDKQASQYIAEYKRVDNEIDDNIESIKETVKALIIVIKFLSLSPLDQDIVNIDTFITSFETIHLAKTISIDLVNRFFKHAITEIDSDLECHELDPFTYINSETYTSDKFYEIMIDMEASKQSTAGYRQYPAYKKLVTHV